MARTETAEKPEVGATIAAGQQAHYRAHIDGLRAVAVYLVVAFHAGLGVMSGGFIGVDVFFVLSGYLVTGILLRDLVGTGRINLRRFYARRFRRILPAAAVTLIVTAIVYSIVASPVEMLDVLGGFKAAFLYVANWYFIRQSVDYFASDINRSPVLHFWSLAVEEQFYLVWPLLFGGLFLAVKRLGRLRWWVLRGIVALGALASMGAAWHIAATNVNRAYYGTDTRAYQLLCGALLALTPQLMRVGRRYAAVARALAPVALAVLVLFATSVFDIGPIARGIVAVALSAVLIIAIESARNAGVGRALGSAPLSYLGRVSYATYLWHWPVIIIATHSRSISPVPLFILSSVVATLLAVVSFHFLERPVRSSKWLDRYKSPVIAVGLAISVTCGLVLLPAILTPDSVTGASGAPLDWRAAQKDIPDLPDCYGKAVSVCTIVRGSGKSMLLVGDSNARMWIPTFTAMAEQRHMTFSVAARPDCPWQRGLQYQLPASVTDPCKTRQADWYDRVIPQLAPDIVVLVHQSYDDSNRSTNMVAADGNRIHPGGPNFELALDRVTDRSLQALRAPNRKLVILEPIPIAPTVFNPLDCISTGKAAAKCTYQAGKSPSPLEGYYDSLANGSSVITVDADRLVCPRLPTCDEVVNGMLVKRDGSHITATFAKSLTTGMTNLFVQRGVF